MPWIQIRKNVYDNRLNQKTRKKSLKLFSIDVYNTVKANDILLINSLAREDLNEVFQDNFSDLQSLVKLPSDECHRTSLVIGQHWFR